MIAAVADPAGGLKDRMCLRFVERLAESDSRFKIRYIQGEALGSASSVMEQHLAGSVDIFCNELVWFASYIPDVQIFGWGFTFRDPQHMADFINSDLFDPIELAARKNGARILSAEPTQPRVLFSTTPIESIADLDGLKMRVPEIRSYLELWKALGTRPTQVAWGEVYLGLTTGVVVAAEGPPTDSIRQNFHRAAPRIVRTDHVYSTVHISINERAFERIDPDLQPVLQAAASEATAWARQEAARETIAMLDHAVKEGATVNLIDRDPFIARSRQAVASLDGQSLWREGLWQAIQEL